MILIGQEQQSKANPMEMQQDLQKLVNQWPNSSFYIKVALAQSVLSKPRYEEQPRRALRLA